MINVEPIVLAVPFSIDCERKHRKFCDNEKFIIAGMYFVVCTNVQYFRSTNVLINIGNKDWQDSAPSNCILSCNIDLFVENESDSLCLIA